jgi:hypothetical protein
MSHSATSDWVRGCKCCVAEAIAPCQPRQLRHSSFIDDKFSQPHRWQRESRCCLDETVQAVHRPQTTPSFVPLPRCCHHVRSRLLGSLAVAWGSRTVERRCLLHEWQGARRTMHFGPRHPRSTRRLYPRVTSVPLWGWTRPTTVQPWRRVGASLQEGGMNHLNR